MNVITREDSDYEPMNLVSRNKKVRAQIRFIKHLFDIYPDILIAGGCAYDHANGVPAKDIDAWFRSQEEVDSLLQQLEVIDSVDQTSDKEYPDTEIERVVMYTVRYKGKGFLLNAIIHRGLKTTRPDIEDRIDFIFRCFPYSDNMFAYYLDYELGLGIYQGNDMQIAYLLRPFRGEVEATKTPVKYMRKRLLTSNVTKTPNRVPLNTPRSLTTGSIVNWDRTKFYPRRPAFYPVLSKGYISKASGRYSSCKLVNFINHYMDKEVFYFAKNRGFTFTPVEAYRLYGLENPKAPTFTVRSELSSRYTTWEVPVMRGTAVHNTVSSGSLPPNWADTGAVTQELQPDRGTRTEVAQPTTGQRIASAFTSIFGSLS